MVLLLQSVLLALSLIASLCLFLSLKRELYTLERKRRREREAPSASFQAAVPQCWFTPAHRMQALGLLAEGEDAAHIASALGVSRREVELLIRVERMVAEPAPSTAAGATTA